MTASTSLPVTRAADLADVPTARRWLGEELWGDQAVGIGSCGQRGDNVGRAVRMGISWV